MFNKLMIKMGYKNYRGGWDKDELKADIFIFSCLAVCITIGLYFA